METKPNPGWSFPLTNVFVHTVDYKDTVATDYLHSADGKFETFDIENLKIAGHTMVIDMAWGAGADYAYESNLRHILAPIGRHVVPDQFRTIPGRQAYFRFSKGNSCLWVNPAGVWGDHALEAFAKLRAVADMDIALGGPGEIRSNPGATAGKGLRRAIDEKLPRTEFWNWPARKSPERQAMFGGIIDSPIQGRVPPPLYQYDINASYLYQLAQSVPSEMYGSRERLDMAGVKSRVAKGNAVLAKCRIKAGAPAIFPVRIPGYENFACYPIGGDFETWLWNPEIRYGAKWIASIGKAYFYRMAANPADQFVTTIAEAKSQKDDSDLQALAKEFAVKAIGRLATRRFVGWSESDVDGIWEVPHAPAKRRGLWVMRDGNGKAWEAPYALTEAEAENPRSMPAVFGYITSKARVALRQFVDTAESMGATVYRMHTDSLLIDKPVFQQSDDMGQLKLDGKRNFSEGIEIRGQLSYTCLADNYHVGAMPGVVMYFEGHDFDDGAHLTMNYDGNHKRRTYAEMLVESERLAKAVQASKQG